MNKRELQKNQTMFEQILHEAKELRWKKYQIYGNSYNSFGKVGVAVRLVDKVERIKNILNNPELQDFESLRDSGIDLLNYAAMFVMELDEEHSKKEMEK